MRQGNREVQFPLCGMVRQTWLPLDRVSCSSLLCIAACPCLLGQGMFLLTTGLFALVAFLFCCYFVRPLLWGVALWGFMPWKPSGSTVMNSSGSHSWIVYGKKKYLLWLNVKLLSASFIHCLFVPVVIAYGPSYLSPLMWSTFSLVISFLDHCAVI